MREGLSNLIGKLAAIALLLLSASAALADDLGDTVRVQYAKGDTSIQIVRDGFKLFAYSGASSIYKYPDELKGLMYTSRSNARSSDVDLDIPAGAKVFLLIDSDKSHHVREKGTLELNQKLAGSGWTRLDDFEYAPGKSTLLIATYWRSFHEAAQLNIPAEGFNGVVVAAKSLALASEQAKVEKKPAPPPPPGEQPHPDATPDVSPMSGPTTRIANQQATIKTLEVYETGSGMMLGQASEAVLTITRGNASRLTSVRFVMPVGNQMRLARDEALRYIHLTYPNWFADAAELTFEDKYVAHDGGSIGAALGTLILSVIKGFDIDANTAITGDISANGKVRAIGGLAAKLRGAAAAKCTVVAVPNDNLDQLIDAMVYGGVSTVSDTQVIGISNLGDAIAVLRSDRDTRLARAIALFGEIQKSLKDEPAQPPKKPADYLHSKEAREKLAQVLELAPNHLSAKLLLMLAQDKQPKTLSPSASEYYTFVAVRGMLDVLTERSQATGQHQVTSGVVRQGLADLRKVRVIADTSVRPLIDAWSRFIEAWSNLESGSGSSHTLETQRQSVLDEMAKLRTDQDLMQKMLKDGM